MDLTEEKPEFDLKKSIIILPGNNYTYKHIKPFIGFLKKQPWVEDVYFIQLIENIYPNIDYKRLQPREYSKYIYNKIPDKSKTYIGFASSMGCYHMQNFSYFYPSILESIILLEPTMCGGNRELLIKFESGRGNKDFIHRLASKSQAEIGASLFSNERVIDIAVSDNKDYWFPRDVKLGIIYTGLNAQGEFYNYSQTQVKNKFLDLLKSRGYKFDFMFLRRGRHAADTDPRFFRRITDFIYSVSK